MVRTRVDGMLGAPRSRSAHARRGAGGIVTVAIHTLTGEHDLAGGMLSWSHSEFHGHTAVWEDPFGSPRTIAPLPPASRCARGRRSRRMLDG